MMADADARVLEQLEEWTVNAKRLQRETLRAILARNAGAGYLRAFLPSGDDAEAAAIDAEAFRRLVPISSYEDYEPLLQRIADGGDPTSLSLDPLVCFFYSTGTTTMKRKMVPYFDSKPCGAASSLVHRASAALLRRAVDTSVPRSATDGDNKILWFLYAGNVTVSKGGYRLLAATAFPMQTNNNNKASAPSPLFTMCSSPPDVLLASDPHQQTYCHLLCGLRLFDSIDGIRAPYAVGLAIAFRLLHSRWPQLCDDLQRGSLSSDVVTDPRMRAAVEALLAGPQPELAERTRRICRDRNWGGVITRLWPSARYVACVSTGSLGQYHPYLRHLCGESLLMLGGDYFASECCVGINMDRSLPPRETKYVLLPTCAYFEFLPFQTGRDAATEAGAAVGIEGVELGGLYEVVVTTYRGLYRYRLDDVVKVVGFRNEAPEVAFVSRALKGAGDAFTERELACAVEEIARIGGIEVVDYACFLDEEEEPGCVVVFVELGEGWEAYEGVSGWCSVVESFLGGVYKVRRATGELGPVRVRVVRAGAFEGLLGVALENGAAVSQYKCPKILRNQRLVDVLKEAVVYTAC